ncbi:MAG TPA: hypothetical protein PLB55_23570 [Prosthecobacter sp.]|nr:hypothetical protein [Prosthecobacter sp.]
MNWVSNLFGVPTKATPAGCVIVLAGSALVGYALACGWVCYLAVQSTEIEDKGSLLRFYGISGVVSLVGGIWLLRFGTRKALEADMSAPDDGPIMR